MRSVTKQAVREARLKEIKDELLHSEKLKVRREPGFRRLLGDPGDTTLGQELGGLVL